MYKFEQIRELFDVMVVQYLSNKNRGVTVVPSIIGLDLMDKMPRINIFLKL